ncbi:MAG: hypothetical protein JWO04_1304 [Gammaproteobacteria bacterium]|nr:hypothetical protein [Gammaproteobacteria bacterium]
MRSSETISAGACRSRPSPIHLDEFGRELPGKNEDWIIHSVADDEFRIDEAIILGRFTKLGKDHVHSFGTNPSRSIAGGLQYGFLKLHVQMYIPQNDPICFQPCVRRGERVPPPPVQTVELFVDFQFPVKSGIQKKLEDAGYRVAWIRDSHLAGLELDGWEVVVERDRQGKPTSFHLRNPTENQVYVKRRV